MLVLSRMRDETIMIGDDIEITIIDIRGDKVRLGITAPITTSVHRKEVYDAIQREKSTNAVKEIAESLNRGIDDFKNGKGTTRPTGERPQE